MITSIRLQNFRSYKDESFEFEPGVNIVVGPNASGKTNLLEAVLVLARGSSFRAKDADLIHFKKPWARLDGFFDSHTRVLKLENEEPGVNKSFVIDDKPYVRLNPERTVPVVFFEPNHLQLVSRGPEARREYFDELLERSVAGFKKISAGYKRALAQRNALLKRAPGSAKSQMFAWDIRLGELGEQIAKSREKLIEDINKDISGNYSRIAGQKSKVRLEYQSQFPVENYASRFVKKLEHSLNTDFERGFTAHGPHREDINFYLNGQQLNQTASRGETRSLILALKVYELGLFDSQSRSKPLFLLDDVFSELDGARRRALIEYLADHQVILTTTDADSVVEHFSSDYKILATQS